jgi:hypothetical protein
MPTGDIRGVISGGAGTAEPEARSQSFCHSTIVRRSGINAKCFLCEQ